jgi:tyrosine-protein kinase Etk/Wzc
VYMNALEQAKDSLSHIPSTPGDNTNVDALDILLVLVANRRLIGIITVAAFSAGLALALLLKPTFTATAVILPPQQQSSSSALLGQLGSLASLGGGPSAALGLKSPADMYIGMLKSRTIADDIIAKFHLGMVYKTKKQYDTRLALKSHTEIESGKDNLIQISITDHDPRRASDIANAYVTNLYSMNSNLAITEAAQRRVFFDQQLDAEKKALTGAEEDLRQTQQKTGIIQLSGQAEMVIRTIAQLRADIASRQVELQSLKTYATDQNPSITRLREEISTMQVQLSKLENDEQHQMLPGDISVPAGRLPSDSLEYARKIREVKYHDTLFDLLSRQYEAARIDEAKSAPIIQIIDHAIPPDRKSGPSRLLLLLASGTLGFIFTSCWVILKEYWLALRSNPRYESRIQLVRSSLFR